MATKTDIELKIVDSVDTSHSAAEVLADSASNPDAFYVSRGYLAKSGQKILESLDPEGEYPDMTVGSASSATRATTAATATTATNISTAPTLAEKNGQITVKVGNKTSNPLTVPFATHAETASDLTGRIEATPEVFTYRPSAGEQSIKDDNAFIRSIKGNSVVWNQLVHGSTYPNTANRYGLECSVKLNSREITVVGTYANDSSTTDRNWYTANALTQLSTGIVGHIYLCRISGNKECSLTLYGWCAGTTDIFDTVILECTSATTLNIALKLPLVSDGIQINETIIVDIHDLTAMFGAGNEPTAEEFRALYPNSYYPYNTGELRNLSCFGIRTVGFNQWDEVWELGYISTIDGLNYDSTTCIRSAGYIRCFPNTEYYISDAGATRVFAFYDADKKFIGYTERDNLCLTPTNCVYIRFFVEYGTNVSTYNNDICINLHHTGYRDGEYERYKEVAHTLPLRQITGGQPLRKAGDVYDEINETEYIKRVGVVDLGSLEWESVYDSDTGLTTFAANRPTACVSTYKSADKANIFCTKYTTDTWNNIWSGKVDKAIGIAQSYIRLRDTSFTTSAALKASLSGVLLQYELAEPIIKPIETPLVLGYYVEDFGTEEAMLAENSAPFSADIIYQFNATDQVRNNTRNLHILQKKALIPSGTAAQYIRGDGSYADIAELSRLTPINDGEVERPDDSAYDILLTLSTHHFAVCPNILDGDSSVGINLTPTDDTASVAEYWLQIQVGDSVPNLAFSAIDDEDAVIVINGTVMINAVNIWHIISTDGGHTYFGDIKNYII